jgi:dienelactone hydrolase
METIHMNTCASTFSKWFGPPPQYFSSGLVMGVVFLGCTVTSPPAQAKLIQEIINVPVKVSNSYGKETQQDIVVTLFHEDALPPPYPVAVINHGRAAKAEQRTAFGRYTAITNARWLAQMGFLVAVPTRVGYGVTGGEDVEDSGSCQRKNYPPVYEAAAVQTQQVLQQVRQRPDVAQDRSIVIGQSFGGTTAITVAAKSLPGVQAAINFAGGGGGNPETQPQEPCATGRLKNMFADYGKTTRTPTLWIYTENDQWMGPKYPREWFDAFKEQGGVGEFVLFPPNGKDGHGLFANAPDVWRATALEFLHANGYPDLKMPEVKK